jgi:hypothetical protein
MNDKIFVDFRDKVDADVKWICLVQNSVQGGDYVMTAGKFWVYSGES